MPKALHIIDSATDRGSLYQLDRLLSPGEGVVCLGLAPSAAAGMRNKAAIQLRRYPLGLAWLARDDAAEVYHAWSLGAARVAAKLAKKHRRPLVVSLQASQPASRLNGLIRLAATLRLQVTVPTQTFASDLIAAGLSPANVHVLPPAACPEILEASPQQWQVRRRHARAELGLADEPLLTAPAYMLASQRHDYATWVHAVLKQLMPRVKLLMGGDGPHEKAVRRFARKAGYREDILLPGNRLPQADYLAAADAALFPCDAMEDFSALADALASGTPIIASDLPALTDCIPGPCALLAPPRNPRAFSAAALRVLEDADLARQLSQSAQAFARSRFDPAACRQRLTELYDAIA